MELQLIRSVNVLKTGRAYCIGHLYVDGVFECDTIEDYDRGLCQGMTLDDIKKRKIQDQTAIPSGIYNIDMDTVSPKYSKKDYYMNTCSGRVPRMVDVPGFSGVLIHAGNTEDDSSGCLIVGMNKEVGRVINSRETWHKLYKKLWSAHAKGEDITIEITRKWNV